MCGVDCGCEIPSRCLPPDGKGRSTRAYLVSAFFCFLLTGLGAGGGYLVGGQWQHAQVESAHGDHVVVESSEEPCGVPRMCCVQQGECPAQALPQVPACAYGAADFADGAPAEGGVCSQADGVAGSIHGTWATCCAGSSFEVDVLLPHLRVTWRQDDGVRFNTSRVYYEDEFPVFTEEAGGAGADPAYAAVAARVEELKASFAPGTDGWYWGYVPPANTPDMELDGEGFDPLPVAITMLSVSGVLLLWCLVCFDAAYSCKRCYLYSGPVCCNRALACGRAAFCICCPTVCATGLTCCGGLCMGCIDGTAALLKGTAKTIAASGVVAAGTASVATVKACDHMSKDVSAHKRERRAITAQVLQQDRMKRLERYYTRRPDLAPRAAAEPADLAAAQNVVVTVVQQQPPAFYPPQPAGAGDSSAMGPVATAPGASAGAGAGGAVPVPPPSPPPAEGGFADAGGKGSPSLSLAEGGAEGGHAGFAMPMGGGPTMAPPPGMRFVVTETGRVACVPNDLPPA